jgi:UDP-GlcNAc:undecaprenyl-phosphate GlcNAc-1-phosphate transferase
MYPFWATFAVAMAASLFITPVARAFAARRGVVDCPDGRRKLQKEPVPLLGGVAIYLALVLGLAVASLWGPGEATPVPPLSLAVICAAGFVCLLGAIDDICDLRPRVKLALQIVSVLPLVLSGHFVDRVVAFGVPIELGWLGIPITVLWIVGCINALNFLDGMDGLAGVVGLATSLMMAVLAANTGHPHVCLIAMVLAGALAGFLVYNLPPASIYLGDCGSMTIGMVVGILSIQAALKTSATLSLTAPAVALAVPMLDTALAIVRRRLSGRSVDTADRGHIHHRLLARGLTNWQALCIIGALCLTTGAAATAATILSYDAIGWLFTLAVIVVLVRTRAFGHHELALVKFALAAMLRALVERLVASTRAMSRMNHQSPLRFDAAWNALAEELAQWDIDDLRLEVERPDGRVERHTWVANGLAGISDCGWSLEMQFNQPRGGGCRLRIAGADKNHGEPWYLLRLVKLMKDFGRHWAENLDRIPAPAVEQPMPLERAPAVQSRAA